MLLSVPVAGAGRWTERQAGGLTAVWEDLGLVRSDKTSVFVSSSGSVAVVLDGYVSDHPNSEGDAGQSGAECLGRLFERYGARAFDLIDGAFVACIVDRSSAEIHVLNDRLGKAGGVLAKSSGRVHVASSVQELFGAGLVDPVLNRQSFSYLLQLGCVPAPHSLFDGVEKIAPATHMTIANGVRVRTYDDLSSSVPGSSSLKMLDETIREYLVASTARVAAVGTRWSSFLSGGLDSSSVVWAASGVVDELETFYGGFGRLDDYMAIPDEADVAADVARAFGARHNELRIGEDALGQCSSIVQAIGEPICDGGPIVIESVLSKAATCSHAIMTGNGGDFLFGGERRHLLPSLQESRLLDVVYPLAQALGSVLPSFGSERISRFRFDLERSAELRRLSVAELFCRRFHKPGEVDRLLGIEERGACQELVSEKLANVAGWDALSQLLYLDLSILTPDLLLRDVNGLARAKGMQAVHPFLDSRFVKFAMGLPPEVKVRGLSLKAALRDAMRTVLPKSVLRKKKGGLGAPVLYWLESGNALVEECLSPDTIRRRNVFDPSEVARMRVETAQRKRDHSMLLWTIFTSELWFRHFFDADVKKVGVRGAVQRAS